METVFSTHEETTREVGAIVGRLSVPGDVVTLAGDLGAGKTRFAQGVAAGVGVDPAVPVVSPTFTIVNEYRGRIPLYHFDLYRLAGEGDVGDLGLEEYLYGNGVSVIEWPERLGEHLPAERLEIDIEIEEENSRLIRLVPHGERYRMLANEVVSAAKKLLTQETDS